MITMPTQMLCADGRYVTTGFPPRSQRDFEALVDWVDELGFRDEFPETVLLDLGVERGGVTMAEITTDELCSEIFGAGREALMFIAERITAEEFFRGGQTRGLACGVVASPEEAFDDPSTSWRAASRSRSSTRTSVGRTATPARRS